MGVEKLETHNKHEKDRKPRIIVNIPPASRRHSPKFTSDSHRLTSARAFTSGSDTYHDVRPGYPPDMLRLLRPARRVLDVGAGTGKFTRLLCESPRFDQVYAIDPSMDMLRTLVRFAQAPAWQATAEHTGCAAQLFDAVTCAQAWHWVDAEQASAELDRITTRDAQVLLVWNTLDVSVPWVHRLSRIMHSGDMLTQGFLPQVYKPWIITDQVHDEWEQELLPAQVHELTHTRSYWLRSNERIRNRVTGNLSWYLGEHLGYGPNDIVALPYRLDGFVLSKIVQKLP